MSSENFSPATSVSPPGGLMPAPPPPAGIPATERAIIGLCHDLNDQLAAVSAYAFLLRRRGRLGELDAPLQGRLDELAQSVRNVRALCRDLDGERGPVGLALLASSANDLLRSHPDGAVHFSLAGERPDAGSVIHCAWPVALRALVNGGIWARRGIDASRNVDVALGLTDEPDVLQFACSADEPVGEALQGRLPDQDPHTAFTVIGPRAARLAFD